MPPNESRFGTAEEAAALYKVPARTVRRWARDNVIPATKTPTKRQWRFDLEQIERDLSAGNRP